MIHHQHPTLGKCHTLNYTKLHGINNNRMGASDTLDGGLTGLKLNDKGKIMCSSFGNQITCNQYPSVFP